MPHLVTNAEQLARLISQVKDDRSPYVVLIAGASGSGKSTEARKIVEALDELGMPLIRFNGEPAYVEMDMFYRADARNYSDMLGGNFDHPMEIDVPLVEKVLDRLIEGKEVHIPIYSFKEGKRIGEKGPFVPDENPVIVVEGIYSIGLLSHRSNLNIFVEAPSRMELFVRRLLRDVERTGENMQSIINLTAVAMSMWNVYGESQRYMSDVILRSGYSILEDRGAPSYQIKIPDELFEKRMPSTARKLFSSETLRAEDIVVGDVEEKLRGRLYFDLQPTSFDISYRILLPNDMPYTKSLKVSLEPAVYTSFLLLSQVMGYRPKIYHREMKVVKEGGVLFKWYPERELVEIESAEENTIREYVKHFRGNIRFSSYYSVGVG